MNIVNITRWHLVTMVKSPFGDNVKIDITRSTEPASMGASWAKQQ